MKELDRRDVLKGLLGLGGLAFTGGLGFLVGRATEAPGANANSAPEPTETPTPTPTETPVVVEKGGVRMQGVPEKVDANVVDVAKGVFKNETGVAPHIFADPGGLLVGPDFGYPGNKNPWGPNPQGWEAMYDAGGSIHPFSPVTQEVVRWEGKAFQNLPEGGFDLFTGGQMTVKIGETIFRMPSQGEGHIYIFAARGLYPDGKQDTDRNSTVEITDYKPGHIELSMYQSSFESNLAFISEGQFLQKVATAHTTGTNCGAEGCSKLTVVAYDRNTGAMEIWEHIQNRVYILNVADAKKGWNRVFSNWR